MSVSRTSMRLATAALVAVIGLGATSTLGAGAVPALAGAGWDTAPTAPTDSTDGAGWDVAPTVVLASSIDGAGWDVAPTTTNDGSNGAGWDSAPTDPSTDGAGRD
ncbi:hypothetical protein [Streptomyces roseolus]|uniref:hypothetical protein n=1 Tax=Streptomyces roseolus TaxID=67358 RepID=UPI001676F366|nr:hypothetical protein [Streptomyces roseolus]GGR21290.1 hypothetical protein GCM10010282_11710 [Streptomyces roseolus]